MSVQAAVFATPRPVASTAFFTSRSNDVANGEVSPVNEENGATGASSSTNREERRDERKEGDVSPLERFLNPSMIYNADARRLVMLFRDPETGKVVDQIPQESAIKQYEEMVRKQEKETRETLMRSTRNEGRDNSGFSNGREGTEGDAVAIASSSATSRPPMLSNSEISSSNNFSGGRIVPSGGADGTRITIGANFNLVV
jgi:uncharacterized FlaG/YvyC family protein